MKDNIKILVKVLLESIIEDGKAGIHNAVMDLDLDGLEREYDKIEYAVQELINLKEDEEGFNYRMLGEKLFKSFNAHSMEECIRVMVNFYESETGTDEDEPSIITDEDYKELIELMGLEVKEREYTELVPISSKG